MAPVSLINADRLWVRLIALAEIGATRLAVSTVRR
jgi:hypothetical protein